MTQRCPRGAPEYPDRTPRPPHPDAAEQRLAEFIELLNWHGVEYLVVGAFASPTTDFRLHGDLDLLIQSFKFQDSYETKNAIQESNAHWSDGSANRRRLRAAGFNRKEALNLRGTI